MFKIGYINFAGIFPVFLHLEKELECSFIYGVPSELNKALNDGTVAVSPVSSLEYMSESENYRILPGMGVCGKKSIRCELLLSDIPINQLHKRRISLSNQSYTSIHLVKVMMEKFYNIEPYYVGDSERSDAKLLIGDDALMAYHHNSYIYKYDLAELWYKHTGLPFVFSIWLVQAKFAAHPYVKALHDALMTFPGLAENAEYYADEYMSRHPNTFTKEQLVDFWKALYYKLGDEEMQGLEKFFKLLGYEPQWYIWGQND